MRPAKYDAQFILNRSYKLFNKGGLINVKVRAVAKACNCSVIPIYNCYQSKEGLQKAVINNAFSVFEKDLLNEIELHRTASLTHDPYWCLHSALSHQPGIIKEVIFGNINIIDKLVQIAHTCFPNNSVSKIRTHIQLICMIINIKNTNKFSISDSSISAFSKVTQDFLKTLK